MDSHTQNMPAARAALNLLPSVLAVIPHAIEVQEHDVDANDRASLDGLKFLRWGAELLLFKFPMLRTSGLDAKLSECAVEILQAVELSVCEEVLEYAPCELCENIVSDSYPRSHALSHQTRINPSPTDRRLSFFPDPSARDILLGRLKETIDKLDALCRGPSEPFIPSETKQRQEPQWGISDFTNKVFHALTCRHPTGHCTFEKYPDTHLALATYSDMSNEDEQIVDVLFRPDSQTSPCAEVRIHKHNPAPTHTKATWWKETPEQLLSFCDLDKAFLTGFQSNVAIGTYDIWQHVPTILEKTRSPQSISLATILAPDTRGLNDFSKLVLAVTLGHALYYLYDGPWLMGLNAEAMSRESIMFFKEDGRVSAQPFLCSKIRSIDSEGGATDASFHPHPVILGFGVILLEIHLGRTLESVLNLKEPLKSPKEKWKHALTVFEQRKMNISWPSYRDAIKACLSLRFGAGEKGLQSLRGIIFRDIVGPLLDDLENSFGGKSGYINLDNIDKQAAGMDLSLELAVAESKAATSPRAHLEESSSIDFASHSSKYKNAVTIVICIVWFFKRWVLSVYDCMKALLRIATVVYGIIETEPDRSTGELHTIFGDPEELPSKPPSEHTRSDKWIKDFQKLEVLDPKGKHRVRIAIIDSGIDTDHVDIIAAHHNRRIAKICDWVDNNEGKEVYPMEDTLGHGTHVASIVLQLTPNVELYVARVTRSRELSDRQAEVVAKAIRTAALTWKCAIINLSLGFHHGIKCIEDALEDAINAHVLVFAAASNDGYDADLAYPAWHPQVLCIYSRTEFGRPSAFNPSADNQNNGGVTGFSIIGEHISGAWPKELSGGKNHCTRRMSGTSFATPIAVAVAARVLGLSRRGFESGDLKACHCKLESNDGMRRVLLRMAKDIDGYKCLNPFKFFNRRESVIFDDIEGALNPTK